jgi:hypothetical protein
VSRGTRELCPARPARFVYGTITLYGRPFQARSTTCRLDDLPGYTLTEPHNPDAVTNVGLGYSPFARRYSENLN